jgi:sugar transferase EpsL
MKQKYRFYQNIGKRLMDFELSIVLLLVLTPVFIIIRQVILWQLGPPAIFVQKRPGLNGIPFRLYKFRTMTDKRDSTESLLTDAERLHRLGRILRATSVDELPELLNVLMGDMSLVGPRPLLISYLPLYSHEQARRHHVKPGITGWVQVNGRNALSWEEKFTLDIWYVDNQSFLLDLKVLILTVLKVIRQEGISSEGHDTMPYFMGNKKI